MLFFQLIENNINKGKSVTLANCLLLPIIRSGNAVFEQFKLDVQSLYHACIDDVDYSADGPEIQALVNKWVKNQTHNLIDSIMDAPPDPNASALILNSIHFQGKWEVPFSNTSNRNYTFFNHGVTGKETEFLIKYNKHFPYKELTIAGEAVQAVELAYNADSISMFIILPQNRDGLNKILASNNTNADLKSAIDSLSDLQDRPEVIINIPKFRLATKYSLKNTLPALGIRNIFSPGQADFSGINANEGIKQEDLYVSEVTHKAVISVDEDGTEAAAVTRVDVDLFRARFPVAAPKVFRADHPFLFFIKDKSSGIVLFIGKVEEL